MIHFMINKKVEFELLEVLVAAGESKNFYEAARKLGISQPAVSIKLKQLEERSPLPVFTLRGKKKILTHYGRELFDASKLQIESNEKAMESLNRKYYEAKKLVLRVGCRNEIFEAVASRLFFEGRTELCPLSSHEAALALLNHEVDIAISYERPDLPEVLSRRVLTSSAHFAVHSKYLNGKRLSLTIASEREFLTQTPCLIYQSDGHLLRDWLAHLKIDFSELRVLAVVQDWRTIQTLVDQGFGFGIVPSYLIFQSTEVRRVSLPKEVLPHFLFYASFYNDLKRIPAFARVLERLKSDLLE